MFCAFYFTVVIKEQSGVNREAKFVELGELCKFINKILEFENGMH